jgi:hypothetical protein
MAKFQNREEYEKWKEAKPKPKQEPIAITEQPSNQADKGEEEKSAVSYNCPSCNSENIQRAAVLVSLGSKKMGATTVGVGVGSSGINAGIGLTGGSIISELAAKLSPPIKPLPDQWKYIAFHSVLFIISVYVFFYFNAGDTAGGFIALCLLIFCIYQGYFRWFPSWKQKQALLEEEYSHALAQWERTFFCLRCGTSFEINRPS